MQNGRYFIHEHPMTATSWKVDCIDELAQSPMVVKAKTHMCAFGMMSKDANGEGPVLKPTIFMTNSIEAQKALEKKCPGHSRHVHLMEGRAAAAQVYPKALCRAICEAIVSQARIDAEKPNVDGVYRW